MKKDANACLKPALAAAAELADEIDSTGRFPKETFQILKDSKLLSCMIPKAFDGYGYSLSKVSQVCFQLGSMCGSTGLVFAMHQIEVAMVLDEHNWFDVFKQDIVNNQLLLASVTSEKSIGGNIRNSACAPIYHDNDAFSLSKSATTISYGLYADALLITSRRNDKAAPDDQILSVILKKDYKLQQTSEWNTMGMRATRSDGFDVEAQYVPASNIFSRNFSTIAQDVMLPTAHILWSSVWCGIAYRALERSRKYIRDTRISESSPSLLRLLKANSELEMNIHLIKQALEAYEKLKQHPESRSFSDAVTFNNLKVKTSESCLNIVTDAMMICGIAGFKNNSPYSISRLLRDIHSARLMVSNDRINSNSAAFASIIPTPTLEIEE